MLVLPLLTILKVRVGLRRVEVPRLRVAWPRCPAQLLAIDGCGTGMLVMLKRFTERSVIVTIDALKFFMLLLI